MLTKITLNHLVNFVFGIPKMECFRVTLVTRLFWGVGKLPYIEPYPYSLYRFSDSWLFRYLPEKFGDFSQKQQIQATALQNDHMTMAGNQGTMGCTPNSVPMVFIVFSRDSWG